MAAFYYKGFDVAEIDSDGFLVPVPSITLDVYNVTAASGLGTVTVDTNAIVAEGSFTGNNGDIVEFSHASYPLTFRQTLTATQDLAYIHPDNHTATYILDNAYASTEEATEGDIYIQDLGDLTQKPVYLGTVKAGETTKLPYQTTLSKNLRLYLVSRDSTGQLSASDMVYAESEDVAVPAPTTGLTGNFLNTGFSINDSAEDHKMTVTVGEDFSANRTLTVTLGNANRQVDIEADLLVAGNAIISGINTGDTITVGTTPIGSGTASRVLFHSASGNYVQESANLTFDGSILTSLKLVIGNGTTVYSATDIIAQIKADGGIGDYTRFNFYAGGGFKIIDRFGITNWDYDDGAGAWTTGRDIYLANLRSTGRIYTPKLTGYTYSSGYLDLDISTTGFQFTDGHNRTTLLHAYSSTATNHLRLGYDASNYYNTTVGSAGAVTFDAVGSGAKFVFSDQVEVAIGTGGETAHVGGKLFQHYTDETTAGTTQEQLYTFTLPAASLLNNGDTIKCEFGGIFTGNGNTKRIYPKFGGTVLATGQTSSASATDWTVDFYVIRVSNTVVRYVVEFTTTGDAPTIESSEITGLNLTTTAYDIDLDGRSVSAAGELTAHSGIGLFYPGA